MIIYHGHPSLPSLAKCREAAPSVRHGAEYSDKSGRRRYDEPYIIDNGAFAAYKNDTEWDGAAFLEMLRWTETHPRDPDFVIVPDVVGDAEATYDRSAKWAANIDYPTYQPVQDGMWFDDAIQFTLNTGSVGIFVGGSKPWKKRTAWKWVEEAHGCGLKCHIGRPWDYFAAYKMGADSIDTTSIVAYANWDRLRRFQDRMERRQTLSEAVA